MHQAEEFLSTLDPFALHWCFQTFDDGPEKRGHLASTQHGTLQELAPRLQTLNAQGAGIFVTVNEVAPGKPRKAENITRTRAVFADFDDASRDNLAALQCVALEPSILVESSPGKFHAYWLVNDMEPKDFTPLQQAIAEKLGTDSKVKDLPRVMRVPGFIHKKGAPELVKLLPASDKTYTMAELQAAFAPAQQPAPQPPIFAPLDLNAPTAAPRGARDTYTQRAIDRATSDVLSAGPGERNNELNAAAYGLARLAAADRLDWGQVSQALERAAVAAGLALSEVRATLKSAWDAGSTDPNFEGMAGYENRFKDTAAGSEGSAWPEPTPLPDDLPPVDAFDSELLPQALRGWVMDIAQRMQCPPDFPAVAVITAVSSVIGARAVVLPKVKDDWQVVPNLWGMIVGRPGVMKSPALTQAIGALNRLEGAAREAWQEKNREWELDCRVAALAAKSTEKQAEKEAAKNPEKARQLLAQQIDFEADNPKPPKRRYVVNDTTMEALADILTDNPWGLLVYRDEMHGLLCSMDKQGQEGARGFFLTGYDGNQGYAVDRIMRGHSYVDRVCLAMLGGIQPGKLQSYVRDAVTGGAGDDGLLQRFGLTVWPDVNQAFAVVDRWPDSEAKNAAGAVFDRLNSLEPDWDDTPQQWRFSPNAQALFYEWLVPFETSIRGDGMHPALVSHLAKWRKLVPALALIFAQVDTPESPGNQIHERELTRALAWAQYLLSHAKRVYSAATTPETFGAKHLLEKIKGGKLVDADGVLLETFAPRQVALKGWAGLAMVGDVRKAAETLTDYGWLARIEPAVGAKGGRPSDLFQLHPCLLQRGAQ